ASVPAAMITSTLRLTSSAASPGSRSSLFSAYLCTSVRLLPSAYPSCRRLSGTVDFVWGPGEPALRVPILQTFSPCCALAPSGGHRALAAPKRVFGASFSQRLLSSRTASLSSLTLRGSPGEWPSLPFLRYR